MFIKRLQLKNFRGFVELDLDFSETNANRNRTLILGENGTGKSNILKAIALVTAGSDALGELLGDVAQWIRFGEKACEISLEMTTKEGKSREIYLELHHGDSLGSVISRSYKSLQEIDSALKYADRNYFVVGYGASRTIVGGENQIRSRGKRPNRAQCVATLLDKNEGLNSLEEWALNLHYQSEEEGLAIVQRVFDFLPGIEFDHIDRKERKLLLKTPDGVVPLSSLSDGYQNMAGWIGDLLFRISETFQDYKDPLNTRGVLLLDEIDLHLHPRWQASLLDFIRETFPNMQLIASTHSPFTAQQAGINELYILERRENGLSLEAFNGNPQELLLHQLVMSDVFGMETDESKYMISLKERYDELKNTDDTSDTSELEEIKERLSEIPSATYSNSILTPDDRSMMVELLKAMKK